MAPSRHTTINSTASTISSSSAAASTAPACVVGGNWVQPSYHGANPDGGIISDMPYSGIAGDDPTNPIVSECCLPYQVQFLPPCILWCPYANADEWGIWQACMRGRGLEPGAEFGTSAPKLGGRSGLDVRMALMYGIVAIAAGLGIAFAIVQRAKVLEGKRAALSAAALWRIVTPSIASESTVDVVRLEETKGL
ncbi:hypothetical protein Micbo1qcDRAFT_156771 [Microdochium bolleyi]|uniref:Uncharacterized protein n=1 Tax=Microdochium bolleyi TaxID=196109 RepID=A0A136JCU0_9PEZI|nr:hypothetical protein Micbo1qcDRAFT_156771 [Microdochium bolleyi]